MIKCELSFDITDEIEINIKCFDESDVEKLFILEIFDLDTNLRVFNKEYSIKKFIHIWCTLGHGIKHYYPSFREFINGYRIKLTNLATNEIEFDDVLLTKQYSRTKFIDKNNLLSNKEVQMIYQNFINFFKLLKNNCLNIKDDDIIVDLGSSIGLFTAYALEQSPNIKSINVEMNSIFHNICSDTFKDNKNIIPINKAIYKNSNETIDMYSDVENFSSFSSNIVNNSTFVKKIPTISLEDIINKYNLDRISLLKVDIEGYEYELFENLDDNILSKIDKIHLEFHKTKDNNDRLILINRLLKYGFKINNSIESDTLDDNNMWNFNR